MFVDADNVLRLEVQMLDVHRGKVPATGDLESKKI